MIFKSTLCKCVSKANFRTKFYRTKNVFETFKIGLTQLKTKKKDNFMNQIFKNSRR